MASIISASTTSATALNLSGDTSGVLQIATGATPTTAITVDASQNVGIGNPAANTNDQVGGVRPLIVSKSDSATTIAGSQSSIVIGNSDTTTNNTSQLTFAAITGANTNYFASAAINCIYGARTNGQYATGQLVFSTSSATNSAPTEKARIDSSGNLLAGTTSATPYQTGNNLVFTPSSAGAYHIVNHTNSVTGAVFYGCGYNGSSIGSITQVGTTSVAYNSTSDYRLKTNAKPIENALITVNALNPVSFTWIDGRLDDGFLAHELQAVLPNCVTGEKDAINEDGTPKYQQMDSSGVIPFLTAAIQELKAIVDTQAEQIKALQGASI